MIDLPRALEPWKSELDVFPRDLALSIGGWLPKLALALGPFAPKSTRGDGPPDGFGGIARRGPYERLLLSEWLLADEIPDEFLRRAAMGEHTFLETARTKPHGAKRSIALFDAGPSQLGAPRIVHIALLVVLYRRAKIGGADFAWGMIQDPDGWLFDTVTETAVLGLLKARVPHESTETDLDDWFERIGTVEEVDDLWLVGASRLANIRPAIPRSFAAITDVLEPGPRRVRAKILRRRSEEKSIELELPPEDASVRLVRDPFSAIKPPPSPRVIKEPIEGGAFTFSPDGRRLLVRDGEMVFSHPIPTESTTVVPVPRLLSPMGDRVIAAGSHKKSLFLVTTDASNRTTLRTYSRRGKIDLVWRERESDVAFPVWRPGMSAPLAVCLAAVRGRSWRPNHLFIDAMGRLFWLRSGDVSKNELDATVITYGVAAIDRGYGSFVIVVNRDLERGVDETIAGGANLHRTGWVPVRAAGGLAPPITASVRRFISRLDLTAENSVDRMTPVGVELTGDGPMTAHFGHPFSSSPYGLLAIEQEPREWTIRWHGAPIQIQAPLSARVFGVAMTSEPPFEPGLLVIESDARTMSIVTRERWRMIASSTHPIKRATAATGRPAIAYLDERGDIAVIANATGKELTRIRGPNPLK